MRGTDVTQNSMFSYLRLEDYVPKEHPLRPIRELFSRVLDQAKAKGLLSSEHFSVDGTLVRAWASHKSFVPKDGALPPSSGSRREQFPVSDHAISPIRHR